GGVNTSGIGTAETEHMIEETISGLPLEFYTRLGRKYGYTGPAFYFESHKAEQVFNEMISEAGVETIYDAFVVKVNKKGGKIISIVLSNGDEVQGNVFIDATYEGDLMARSGVDYTYGRESKGQYNESLAGIRLHDKPVEVSPYGDDGNLLPGFVEAASLKNGEASKRVINYNFRMVLSTGDDRMPIPPPDNYDPSRFILLKRLLIRSPDTRLSEIIDLYTRKLYPLFPKGKYEANNKQNALISLGLFGGNAEYPDADYEKRKAIFQDHKDWTLGLFHFLLTDSSVPESLKREMRKYGLAKDEFVDNNHFPYYLYIREARRMIGRYVHTQKDIFIDTKKTDAIALGSHFVDCHHVQRVAVSKTQFVNEGRIWEKPEQPYEIAYRVITPQEKQCSNLLVPVCVSASHVAFCSIRVEVTWMQLGHAAGIAASMASEKKKAVQQISLPDLQEKLKQEGAIISVDHQLWETHDKL
ncbi:MAG: FAD-dependent oxidoreductase, partial [Chitinophagaceae bacterium]|nr:FAD-dependent oxidoreductase [Chitinophagaceae bacterium]